MNEFLTVLSAVVPVFAIAGAGFVVRKLTWLTEEADQSLLRLTINLLFPCFILDAALGNPALARWDNLALAPVVGFGTVVLGMFIAKFLAPAAGLKDSRSQGTFALTVGMYNYGFIPIPLAMLLFDSETVGVLFVHNVGVEIALWTVGLLMLTGAQGVKRWKKVINAPLGAVLLVLTLNLTNTHTFVPAFILTTAHLLAQCAIPLSLLLVGATMADHLVGAQKLTGWRVIAAGALLRLGLLPLGFLLLARLLPCSLELKRVILLEAAMPSAVFPIVMAKHYGGHTPTALRVVIGTSLMGLITIPLWIRWGSKLVGL